MISATCPPQHYRSRGCLWRPASLSCSGSFAGIKQPQGGSGHLNMQTLAGLRFPQGSISPGRPEAPGGGPQPRPLAPVMKRDPLVPRMSVNMGGAALLPSVIPMVQNNRSFTRSLAWTELFSPQILLGAQVLLGEQPHCEVLRKDQYRCGRLSVPQFTICC